LYQKNVKRGVTLKHRPAMMAHGCKTLKPRSSEARTIIIRE
jgi:hypothetical protein